MEETKNYANGKSLSIPENEQEKELAIRQWSEGNPDLEDAIRACIDNGIRTQASCGGHGKIDDDPYLAIEINEENIKKIYSILNSVFANRDALKSIDIYDFTDTRAGEFRRDLAIHAKPKLKAEIFKLISEGAKKEIELEDCAPIIQGMVKAEKYAYENAYWNAFSYTNLGPAKAIVLLNDTLKYNQDRYKEANMKRLNMCLTDSQVLDKLSKISEVFGAEPQEKSKKKFNLIDRIKNLGKKKLPEGANELAVKIEKEETVEEVIEKAPEKHSWDLTEEEKKIANSRTPNVNQEVSKNDIDQER